MTRVTIQVVEGLERGCVYTNLQPPITIGREDDNVIRLNDERVSRFHAKIQEDGGRIILTDLDSTNGTRVNGHPVQMRVLQIGDQIAIGRCLLIVGSRDEVAKRYAQFWPNRSDLSDSQHSATGSSDDAWESGDRAEEAGGRSDESVQIASDGPHGTEALAELFPGGPPEPPQGLGTLQRAQVADMLAYAHDRIRSVLQSAVEDPASGSDGFKVMRVEWPAWQRLLALEMDLASYLRKIAEPDQ